MSSVYTQILLHSKSASPGEGLWGTGLLAGLLEQQRNIVQLLTLLKALCYV